MALIETEEAAKRLARVIISDIELYNREAIASGSGLARLVEEGFALFRSRVAGPLHPLFTLAVAGGKLARGLPPGAAQAAAAAMPATTMTPSPLTASPLTPSPVTASPAIAAASITPAIATLASPPPDGARATPIHSFEAAAEAEKELARGPSTPVPAPLSDSPPAFRPAASLRSTPPPKPLTPPPALVPPSEPPPSASASAVIAPKADDITDRTPVGQSTDESPGWSVPEAASTASVDEMRTGATTIVDAEGPKGDVPKGDGLSNAAAAAPEAENFEDTSPLATTSPSAEPLDSLPAPSQPPPFVQAPLHQAAPSHSPLPLPLRLGTPGPAPLGAGTAPLSHQPVAIAVAVPVAAARVSAAPASETAPNLRPRRSPWTWVALAILAAAGGALYFFALQRRF